MKATGDRRWDRWRYRRAVARAFARVTYYREQWAAAGGPLPEPAASPVDALPEPPHTLYPFPRRWLPSREPSLWTPGLRALARALWLAGCRDRIPVLEVREALLDHLRLPGRWLRPGRPYRVLLSPAATVASPQRRAWLEREALAVVEAAGAGWVVAGPADLAALPAAGDPRLRPVVRLPVAAAAEPATGGDPAVLYEPRLGYLGAKLPGCGQLHLDHPRVFGRDRDGALTLSLPGSRRPTLLEILPAGADRVGVGRCPRHGTPVLVPRPRSAGVARAAAAPHRHH